MPNPTHPSLITAGIDVGGSRKGHHVVALSDGSYLADFRSDNPTKIASWCCDLGAHAIAIDAPCSWSLDGKARPCEAELIKHGIQCFPSPTRETAVQHPTNYYGWMIEGERIYQALSKSHQLVNSVQPPTVDQPLMFETFPHAITHHLQGGRARAADKQRERRLLLKNLGIQHPKIKSIDTIDATLCAYTAYLLSTRQPCHFYGEAQSGLIICPK